MNHSIPSRMPVIPAEYMSSSLLLLSIPDLSGCVPSLLQMATKEEIPVWIFAPKEVKESCMKAVPLFHGSLEVKWVHDLVPDSLWS